MPTHGFKTRDRTPIYEEVVRLLSQLDFRARQAAFAEAHAEEQKTAYTRNDKKPKGGKSWWGDLLGLKTPPRAEDDDLKLPGDDHMKTWLQDGTPVAFTSQPYDLSLRELKGIVEHCEKHGLTVHIRGESWHYPGRTMLVEYRRSNE